MLETLSETRPASGVVGRRLRWFFPAVSGVLLATVLIGFAPSFFLHGRIAIPVPLASLPPYLFVHGVLLTTWYVLLFVQTCPVGARRVAVHRRLGVLAGCVAVLLVPVSALVVVRAIPRLYPIFGRDVRGLVVGDLLSLVFFSVFVAAALYYRARPDIHRRLMVSASFVIFAPALERLFFFYQLPRLQNLIPVITLVTLAVYDLLTIRRPHRVTLWAGLGTPAVVVVVFSLPFVTRSADALVAAVLAAQP